MRINEGERVTRLVAEYKNQLARARTRSEFALQLNDEADRCWEAARRLKREIDELVYEMPASMNPIP